jgi:predicted MPP superfamily phosphohydrolase
MSKFLKLYAVWTWAVICVLGMALQAYAVLETNTARQSPMPDNFGNFPKVREMLPAASDDLPFTFVIVGDTRSVGTFERLAEDITSVDPAFVVILGDWVNGGSPEQHAYFHQEAPEYDFSCPVFFTPGNHDVNPEKYTLDQFEKEYGPRNFSFVFKNNIFIFISHLDKRFSNKESLEYLRSFDRSQLEKYDRKFVFMHIPPYVSPDIKKRHTKDESELIKLFQYLNIDYVIAADFHGYNRTKLNNVEYIITGGGGARLDKSTGQQFHHAIAITLNKNMLSEKILPVSANIDIEDVFQMNAIVYVGPFILNHLYLCLALNILAGVVAGWALRGTRRSGMSCA